jgi:hypothetical protein
MKFGSLTEAAKFNSQDLSKIAQEIENLKLALKAQEEQQNELGKRLTPLGAQG